jgi:hypothetical protein
MQPTINLMMPHQPAPNPPHRNDEQTLQSTPSKKHLQQPTQNSQRLRISSTHKSAEPPNRKTKKSAKADQDFAVSCVDPCIFDRLVLDGSGHL